MSKIDLTITEDIKKKFLYNKSKYLSSLEKNKKVEVITIDDDSDEISQEKIEKLDDTIQNMDKTFIEFLNVSKKKNQNLISIFLNKKSSFSFSHFILKSIFANFQFQDFTGVKTFKESLIEDQRLLYKDKFNKNNKIIDSFLTKIRNKVLPKYISSLYLNEGLISLSYCLPKNKRRFIIIDQNSFINSKKSTILSVRNEHQREIDCLTIRDDILSKLNEIMREILEEGIQKN